MKILYSLISLSVLLPGVVFAQECEEGKLCNPLEVDSIEGLFGKVLSDIILPLSAIIGTIFIIWAGFGFVTAQGKDAELVKARARLKYVLIGVAIVIGAQVILDLLLNTLTELANV